MNSVGNRLVIVRAFCRKTAIQQKEKVPKTHVFGTFSFLLVEISGIEPLTS